MTKKRKKSGIESLKNRYGFIFISPWLLGMLVFFLTPLVQSVIFSFSKITVVPGGIEKVFSGFSNYRDILVSDPNYLTELKQSVVEMIYSLPIILLLSIVLALMLNQNFRGRLFFRSLYFMPVIIATGQVIELIFLTTKSTMTDVGVSGAVSANMIDVSDIISSLGLTDRIADYVNTVMNKIFDLLWSCGIQIVLFLAGLQSIPATLYEASNVEGATKWEEFWFITFPSLSRVTMLVMIFTMIELLTNARSTLISTIYKNMQGAVYDRTSAMIWFYFLVSIAVMGFILLLYNRFLMRRWE